MTALNRIGGAAALVGGAVWLAAFGTDAIDRSIGLDAVLWSFPLLFGLATVALHVGAGSPMPADRIGAGAAIVVALVASVVYVATLLLAATAELEYAGWLVFILGIALLLVAVLVYGLRHVRRPEQRRIAAAAIVASILPVGFIAMMFVYKLLTGWWVTDPGLIQLGSTGAALLVGGGWLLLGIALWLRPKAPPVRATI